MGHPELVVRQDVLLVQLLTAMNRVVDLLGGVAVDEPSPLTGDWLREVLMTKRRESP